MSRYAVFLLIPMLSLLGEAYGKGFVYDFAPVNCGTGFKSRQVVAKLGVKDKKECSDWCDKLDSCQSFQVQNPKERMCTKLMRTAGKEAHYMMPKKGFTYKEKVTPLSPSSSTCTEMAPKCNGLIDYFYDVEVVAERGDTWGWWGRDTKRTEEEDPRYFWSNGYSNLNTLYWYESIGELWADKVRNSFTMTHNCDGAQLIIHDGMLYCRHYNDRQVIVYDIDNRKFKTYISFDSVEGKVAGYNSQCQYQWGGRSDIDIDVDETGLYVIWGNQQDSCKFALSRINTETYEIEKTWFTGIRKNDEGQAFMICGRLFVIDHYHNNPTYIRYVYDTRTHNTTSYDNSRNHDLIYWPNEHGYLASAHYNPTDGFIYTWNNIRHGRKRPHFVDRSYEETMWMNV